MKKILALVMCLSLMLAVTACGGETTEKRKDDNSSTVSTGSEPESPAAASDEEMIIGSWTGKMSVSEDFVEQLIGAEAGDEDEAEEMAEMLQYFDLNQLLNIDFTLTFNQDGTCTMTVTDEAAEEYVDNIVDVICDGMLELMKDAAEENGMTWEELLETMDMTEQEYRDAMLAEVDKDEMIKEFKEDVEAETEYYKLEGGKLYTADDEEFEGDDLEVSDYELTETTLTMTFEDAVTATFTKVK